MLPAFYAVPDRLAPEERLTFVRLTAFAWLTLLYYDLSKLWRRHRSYEHIRTLAVRRRLTTHTVRVDVVCRAVDEACVWYPWPIYCLQRSYAITNLSRRQGIDATLVIGYRPVPFESHAWVEVDDRVVNDRPQYKRNFSVLARL
jgi:hypothetical protein